MFTFLALCPLILSPSHELRTELLHVTVGETGSLTALVDPRDGRNHLPVGQPAPLLQIRTNGEYRAPERFQLRGERMTLEYPGGFQVELKVEEKRTHLRFEVLSVQPADGVELVMWGPYSTDIGRSVGETIGVVRGLRYAIGLQGLNPKTLGGSATTEDDVMPSYNIFAGSDYCDVAGDLEDLYRGDAAVRTEFGSTIQAYTRDRSQDRVIENWGHPRFVAPAYEDGGVVGSAIALFGCPVEDALTTIGEIELAEGLPHPLLGGEWAKTAREATASYLIIGFGEESIDEAIELTERAGLKYLYHGGPFASWGQFTLNEAAFPRGWAGLKACVDQARKHGLGVGVHTLSNFISPGDELVTPVPDPGLAVVGSTVLLDELDAEADVVEVEDGGWFEQLGALRTARIDDELIQYSKVEGGRLVGCRRGAFGTTAASHGAGSPVHKLHDHGYRTFLTDATLSRTVAERIAKLFNETGLRQVSFDGLEGNWSTGMGQYGRTLFANWWYDALEPELRGRVVTDASNPGHYFWHVYTRMNWGEPWYAGFRESQTQYRLMNQRYFERNLMPRMLGWFKMTPSTSLEDAEWLLARAAGFDAGFAFVTSRETVAANGRGEAILAAIRTWEEARQEGVFPDALRKKLQDITREYRLAVEADGWALQEVYSFKGTHNRREQPGMPTVAEFALRNPFPAQAAGLILRCSGKVAAGDIAIEIDGRETVPGVSLAPGEALRWEGVGDAVHSDVSWRELGRVALEPQALWIPSGDCAVRVICRFNGSEEPELKIELRTKGEARLLGAGR